MNEIARTHRNAIDKSERERATRRARAREKSAANSCAARLFAKFAGSPVVPIAARGSRERFE